MTGNANVASQAAASSERIPTPSIRPLPGYREPLVRDTATRQFGSRTLHGQSQQRSTTADRHALTDVIAELKTVGREQNDGRAMLEPSHFLAFPQARVAGERSPFRWNGAGCHVQEAQPDARHQYGGDRDQGH